MPLILQGCDYLMINIQHHSSLILLQSACATHIGTESQHFHPFFPSYCAYIKVIIGQQDCAKARCEKPHLHETLKVLELNSEGKKKEPWLFKGKVKT